MPAAHRKEDLPRRGKSLKTWPAPPAAHGKEMGISQPTLSEGKLPGPGALIVWQPELEKQKDTYLPGQGCCTGEDRALEAATAQRAECSEPPPGRAGWHPLGAGAEAPR